MNRTQVTHWVEDYERLWRAPGTEQLTELFTDDATYLPSPWAEPVRGRDALAAFWESERDGPDEEFTLTYELVAVDGNTAVIRAEVAYADPASGHWRDLWVVSFADDGRCAAFEEWPFAPDQPDGH
jgi:ketosteroid isomerase-like protein